MPKRILTCAVTGGAPVSAKGANVPVTPREIAESAIGAAKAGAAIVHLHARDPQTRAGSMRVDLFREIVERIRDSGVDVILNLSTGDGAMFAPDKDNPMLAGPGSNMRRAIERVQHVIEMKPEVCSLDFNTMWFRTRAFVNSPEMISEMAQYIYNAGVTPELEIFDTGDLHLAMHLMSTGAIRTPAFFQIVLGASYGASASTETMLYMRNLLPQGMQWAAFGIGRHEFPMLAQAMILGGHSRVGFEDNLYLSAGQLAPDNASLVRKGVEIMQALGYDPATPVEARQILGLPAR
ncbi:MAG: 3-keto-5-aminohexanoate cleavage protein [Alphaproteobacteria bacterium]|nr:3-keto-5-aminohexanoate cleavage protein [Alphaproteobacteria bacterium]